MLFYSSSAKIDKELWGFHFWHPKSVFQFFHFNILSDPNTVCKEPGPSMENISAQSMGESVTSHESISQS